MHREFQPVEHLLHLSFNHPLRRLLLLYLNVLIQADRLAQQVCRSEHNLFRWDTLRVIEQITELCENPFLVSDASSHCSPVFSLCDVHLNGPAVKGSVLPVDLAALHDEGDAREFGNVGQRAGVRGYQIGRLARFDGADFVR